MLFRSAPRKSIVTSRVALNNTNCSLLSDHVGSHMFGSFNLVSGMRPGWKPPSVRNWFIIVLIALIGCKVYLHSYTVITKYVLSGQFIYEEVTLTQLPGNITAATGNDPQEVSVTQGNSEPGHMALRVKERTVDVVKKSRHIYSGTHTVRCWFAKNNAAKLIDGQYKDYLVSHMFDTEDWPHGANAHWDTNTHTHNHRIAQLGIDTQIHRKKPNSSQVFTNFIYSIQCE